MLLLHAVGITENYHQVRCRKSVSALRLRPSMTLLMNTYVMGPAFTLSYEEDLTFVRLKYHLSISIYQTNGPMIVYIFRECSCAVCHGRENSVFFSASCLFL
jgi:hypothetical protein